MARTPTNVAASVRARLLYLAREGGHELQRLLVTYALERFLYRIGESEHADRFVLKGAMLFQVWEGKLPRATRDLDLLGIGNNSEPSLRATFAQLWKIRGGNDGIELDPASLRTDVIRERETYAGLRIKCRVRLGSALIPLQVDIGSGDSVFPPAERISYPTLLDLPAPRILAYPKEATIAEKPHVIVDRGLFNSRLKDYFDLWRLAQTHAFNGETLGTAIQATFSRRNTPVPDGPLEGLSSEFIDDSTRQTQWNGFQRRVGLAPQPLAEVVLALRTFIEPLLSRVANGRVSTAHWLPGGPWVP